MSLDNVSLTEAGNGLASTVLSDTDIERYLPELREHYSSDEKALECLRALAQLMCAWADAGWGIDSFHLAFPMLAEFSSDEETAGLGSSHQNIEGKFTAATRALPGSENK